MKRIMAVVLTAALVSLLVSSPAGAGGFPRHDFQHFHHFHHPGAFFFGFGVGALLTAPLWYPPAYAYPGYPVYYPAPPVVTPPPPVYWYYCQNPPGYYPYVPQCPGGWLTVVPPGAAQ